MSTLFGGGKLFDGANDPVDGFGVLVTEGFIERVAPVGEFAGFAGEVVDTTGGTVMVVTATPLPGSPMEPTMSSRPCASRSMPGPTS